MLIMRLKAIYAQYIWTKALAFLGIILGGTIVSLLSGGFPPWSWHFLGYVITHFQALWSTRGTAMLFPFLGLVLLSLSLLIIWVTLVVLALKIVIHWWQDFTAHQCFQRELREAEQLSEEQISEAIADENEVTMAALQVEPVLQSVAVSQKRSSTPAHAARAVGETPSSTPATSSRRPAFPVSQSSYVQSDRLVSNPRRTRPLTTPDSVAKKGSVETTQPERLRIVPPLAPGDELNNDDDDNFSAPVTRPQKISRKLAPDESQSGSASDNVRLLVGIGLDPGIARKDAPNEDSVYALQGLRVTDQGAMQAGLFIVADGMGGHAHGREASRSTVHTMSDVIVPALLRDVSGRNAAEEEALFMDMLKDGVHRANLSLYRRNRELPEMMGTTVTAALVVGLTAYVVNVGDSRTYHYRPASGLSQITRDHSVVARMVEKNIITRDEVYTHPRRNQIYRCLGEHASVEMDTFVITLRPGDVLLLCSDGLWEMVRDPMLEKIAASCADNPSQLSSTLIQAALDNGGADNVSVVTVGIVPPDD